MKMLRLTAEQGREFLARSETHRKYKNRPTGGYASVKEGRTAADLKLAVKLGYIRDLREQVPYILIPPQFDADGKHAERAVRYFADFVYVTVNDGAEHVVDVKSEMTRKLPEYVIKRKLMRFVHKIVIEER
jgi:hypothetical protein